DANTNTTVYAYDSLDRLIQTTEADGTASSLVWSPRSNVLREENANGTVITNTYDLLDRLVRRDITPGSGVAATTTFETFTYDGVSQLVAATNNATHVEFTYDSHGNTCSTSGGLGAVGSTHDSLGNQISMTYPGGRVVTYSYDVMNQVTNVSSGPGGLPPTSLASFFYDGDRLSAISRANNVNTRIQWNGLVAPPNASGDFGWGQVRGINHQVGGNGPVIDRRTFAYDQTQNKTLRAQTAPFYQGGDMTTNVFDYDALDRLRLAIKTKGTSAQRVDYSLDGNGNRLEVAVDLIPAPYTMDNTFPVPADFQMNQYTLTPFVVAPEQYDENGNLIGRTTATAQLQYVYDYADRLVAVNDLFTGFIVPVASYSYDALGRRISKTVYPPIPALPVTTEYVYGGDDDCDGDILEVHENGALKFFAVSPHMHQIGSHLRISAAGEVLYAHADDLGNVLALTDATGVLVARTEYDDYGSPTFLSSDGFLLATNASPVGDPFLFHGMEWEPELGWYHVHVRDYNWRSSGGQFLDPQTGRAVRGKVKNIKDSGMGFSGSNPWSGGGAKNQITDSDGRIVRKMIPVTAPDITGAQRTSSGGMKGGWLGSDGGSNDFESDDDVAKKTDKNDAVRSKKRIGFDLQLADAEKAKAEEKLKGGKLSGPKLFGGRAALRSPLGSN
ncbi:MAG: hypothetical protein AAB370_06150, partial [Verrucomicrobiota bacterium]